MQVQIITLFEPLYEIQRTRSCELCICKIRTCDLFLPRRSSADLHPLHHMSYAHAKFKDAMSEGLGGDAFTRKYII